MRNQRVIRSVVSILVASAVGLLLPACGSTRVRGERTAAGARAGSVRNVTIVSLDPRADVRKPFERDVASKLKRHGVTGNPSFERFSLDELKGDWAQVRKRLADAGAEAILYVRLANRVNFSEGSRTGAGDIDVNDLDAPGAIGFGHPESKIDSHLFLEAQLFRVADGAILWSGSVNSLVKEDDDYLVVTRRIADAIVDRMASDRIIP